MSKKIVKTDKEIMELGRKLRDLYDTGYVNRKQALWFSFLKGLVGGFGAFLGGTIIIGLLLAMLSLFSELPFLGQIVETVQRSLKK